MTNRRFLVLISLVLACSPSPGQADPDFAAALENGRLANEGFIRCHRYVEGWLAHADPQTGLIPRNLTGSNYWNAADAAADNYPFMVLTCALTDSALFHGTMLEMLETETALTSRIGNLPDTWDFGTGSLQHNSLSSVIFGSSEYVKDGLLPLTEWLGPSPWCDRMIGILDDIWANAEIQTAFGAVPSTSHEVAGELLQTLSRVYWMTGQEKYLDWALRLGDYFLLGDHHPTDDAGTLRLRDHGNEVIAGLAELYATLSVADTARQHLYREPLYRMLDRILEIGRNEDGFFYNEIYPQSGTHSGGLADNWGYVLNAHYTVWLVDGTEEYREAVLLALENSGLPYYTETHRFGEVMDGEADAIESALNLYNREYPLPARTYMDRTTRRMWDLQQEDGVIEGWHGDGNFARTTLMYCLWKTRGMTVTNWNPGLVFGAVSGREGDSPLPLEFTVNSPNDYEVVRDGVRTGQKVYTDRNYALDSVPEFLLYATLIQTACDDKHVSLDELISFKAPTDLVVYVGIDGRTDTVPDWLKTWKELPDELSTSLDELTFRIYGKFLPADSILVLGGPQSEGFRGYESGGNYIVLLAGDSREEFVPAGNQIKVTLLCDAGWSGKLIFDRPRHQTILNLPFNWTRINQFPEWFTVEEESTYTLTNLNLKSESVHTGRELAEGIFLELEGGKEMHLILRQNPPTSVRSFRTENPAPGTIPPAPGKFFHQSRESGWNGSQPFRFIMQEGSPLVDLDPTAGIRVLRIFDLRGELAWSCRVKGENSISWPAGCRNGIYILQALSDREIHTRKVLVGP